MRTRRTEGTIDRDVFRRLCRARDLLCDGVDDAPDLRALARAAGMSPYHLLRVFRRGFGETPHELLTRVRVERAKAALRAGRSVTETCLDVGFSSLGSFSALFRRRVGVSPSAYQRSLRSLAPSAELIAPVLIPFCFLEAFAPASARIAILEKPLPFRP
jgi:AraC-like DNA-binding protein